MSKRSSGMMRSWHLVAEGAANAADVVVEVLDGFLGLVGGEYADEDLGEREVWSRANGADADEKTACLGSLLSEDFGQLFFEEAVDFV